MTKAEEAAAEASHNEAGPSSSTPRRTNEPPPPAYEPPAYDPSAVASPTSPLSSPTSPLGEIVAPTITSPFNFPTDSDLPPYQPQAAALSDQKPMAIPQLQAVPTAAYISAYPSLLLNHGVTKDTWISFLDTLSAFLTAKVSDRAISHTGDLAKNLTEPHRKMGKDLINHAKDVGKYITTSAKKGDVLGAAFGAIGGAVTIPLFTVGGIVGTTVGLPGIAIASIVKKPRTPAQRAVAYTAVANKKWLHSRGLHAQLLDSNEFAKLLGVPVLDFLKPAQMSKDRSPARQLEALEGFIAPLELQSNTDMLELDTNTVWLVLAQGVPGETEESPENSSKNATKARHNPAMSLPS